MVQSIRVTTDQGNELLIMVNKITACSKTNRGWTVIHLNTGEELVVRDDLATIEAKLNGSEPSEQKAFQD